LKSREEAVAVVNKACRKAQVELPDGWRVLVFAVKGDAEDFCYSNVIRHQNVREVANYLKLEYGEAENEE
jgi:hypothetical protein